MEFEASSSKFSRRAGSFVGNREPKLKFDTKLHHYGETEYWFSLDSPGQNPEFTIHKFGTRSGPGPRAGSPRGLVVATG